MEDNKSFNVASAAHNMIIETMSDAMIVLDTENNLVDCNPAATQLLNLSPAQSASAVSESSPAEWRALFEKYRAVPAAHDEISIGRAIFDVRISTILDEYKIPQGRLFCLKNVTDYRHVEEVLRKSEEKFSKAFLAAPEALIITRLRDGIITEINEGFTRLTGFSRDEARGKSIIHLEIWANLQERDRGIKILLENKSLHNYEFTFRTKSGQLRQGLYSGELIRLDEEEYGLAIVHDITEQKKVEKKLQESESRLRIIFETSHTGIMLVDAEGKITFANQRMAEMFKCSLPALLNSIYSDHIFPDEKNIGDQKMRQLIAGEIDSIALERHYLCADGSDFWGLLSSRRIDDENGQLESLVGIITDISPRKQAENALRESERTARAILNTPSYFALLVDQDGLIIDLNETAATELGLSAEAAIGRRAWDFLSPAMAASRMDKITQAVATSAPIRWEDEHSGQYFENSVYPVQDPAGGIKRLVIFGENITERKQAEETLRESEARYHRLVENAPIGIISIDAQGQIVDVNPKMIEILGSPSAEATKDINMMTFPPLIEAGLSADFKNCLETGEGSVTERLYRTMWDKVVYMQTYATPVKDAEGAIVGVQAVIEDISIRKRAEVQKQAVLEELRQEYRRLDDIIDFLPDATLVINREGQVIAWNRAMEMMTGVPKNDMLGQGDLAYSIPLYGEKRPILIDLALLPNEEFAARNYQNIHRQGDLLFAEAHMPKLQGKRDRILWGTATHLRNAAGELIGAIESIRDITERKKAEEALQASEAQFRWLAENVQDIIWLMDLDLRFTYVSPAVTRVLGFTPEEALKMTLLETVTPTSMESVLQAQAQRQAAEDAGKRDWVSRLEVEQYCKDGSSVWMEVLTQSMYDEQGHSIGYLGVSRNIAERKEYELQLQQAKEAAESANRAKSIFLATMSHELRTPLNAILGFSEFISRAANLTIDQRDQLSIINQSGEHLLQIINDILEITKIETGRSILQDDDFDLLELLQSIKNILLLRAQQQNTELVFNVPADTPHYVRSDQGKLRQVLMNLLSNAIKFTANGKVSLTVKSNQAAPNRLSFAIEDNGVGIAAEEISLLFNAFAQTNSGRRTQQGTGLGLAISRAYVQLLGGEISVRSQPSLGSCFEFDFQFSQPTKRETGPLLFGQQPRALGLLPGQRSPEGGPFRILIVEDVEASRLLLENLLKTLGQPFGSNDPAICGFEVRSVENGQEAVRTWEIWHPHLIWMDIWMPVMDGIEATRYIKSHPGGKTTTIIALTASAFEEERQEALNAGFNDFVRKPFREKFIVNALAKYLGVNFVHEKTGSLEPAEIASASPNLENFYESLPSVPDSWLKDVQQALVDGEIQKLRSLAERIQEHAPALSERMAAMVQNFEMDELSKLIQSLQGEE